MIKLYITAREVKDNGSAVTLFEDYQLAYEDEHVMYEDMLLVNKIYDKIIEVEKVNNQTTTPF